MPSHISTFPGLLPAARGVQLTSHLDAWHILRTIAAESSGNGLMDKAEASNF